MEKFDSVIFDDVIFDADEMSVITVDGVDRTSSFLRYRSSIQREAFGQPSTATLVFKADPADWFPVKLQPVSVTTGTTLLFAGTITAIRRLRFRNSQRVVRYECRCKTGHRKLDRRLVNQGWASTSATTIVTELFANWTSGFTTHHVQAGLPSITLPNKMEYPSRVLDRLCDAVGATWYLDDANDLHLFIGTEVGVTMPDALDTTNLRFRQFTWTSDDDQIRTRVYVEGLGTTTTQVALAGASRIAIADSSMFSASGGLVITPEADIFTYTGLDIGGIVASVAGSVPGPASAPTIAGTTNGGILSGTYRYQVAFANASGETTPSSASLAATPVAISAPGSSPSVNTLGSTLCNLAFNAYRYRITFVTSLGETTGSSSTSFTPTRPTGLVAGQQYPFASAGGSGVLTGNYSYALAYRTPFGEGNLSIFGSTAAPVGETVTLTHGFATSIYWDDVAPLPSGYGITAVIYRTQAGGSTYFELVELDLNAGSFTDNIPDNDLGPSKRSGYTAGVEHASLTSIALGGTGTLARRIYRTKGAGSEYFYIGQISDNTTTTFTDTTPDSSLTVGLPLTNTAGGQTVQLSGIAIGGTGITQRILYRTKNGGSDYFYLATLNNNVATTFTDNIPDTSLGRSPLTTSSLGAITGDTSLTLSSVVGFPSAGFVVADGQFISYTGISSNTLTGIPASGAGSIKSTLKGGVSVTTQAMLTGVSGLGGDLIDGHELNLLVQRDDAAAQAAITAVDPDDDGIYEHYVQDRRLSIAGATARGDAELDLGAYGLESMSWITTDPLTWPGRIQTITGINDFTGDVLIHRVRIFWDPKKGRTTQYEAEAGSRLQTLHQIIRQLEDQAARAKAI